VKSAQGVWLELESGQKIIDCISSWWVNLHGHGHPAIAEAIYQQALKLEQVIFSGFSHEPAEQLATQLVACLPAPLNRVFYSDNGSTAVEVGLKTNPWSRVQGACAAPSFCSRSSRWRGSGAC
jgi:adenosylmethionine---8-amino-7-oxononanoate aminotransferase